MPRYGDWHDPPPDVAITTTLESWIGLLLQAEYDPDTPPSGLTQAPGYDPTFVPDRAAIVSGIADYDRPSSVLHALTSGGLELITAVNPTQEPTYTPDATDPDAVGFEVEPGGDPFTTHLRVTGVVERFVSDGVSYPARLLVAPEAVITAPPDPVLAGGLSFSAADSWQVAASMPTSEIPDSPPEQWWEQTPFAADLPAGTERLALVPLMVPNLSLPWPGDAQVRIVSATVDVIVTHHARWRFIYTGGHYRVRQRQSLAGTDSWPLRQRQNGATSGSWPLRQRQSGL